MKIGIVGAMAQEVEILLNLMTDKIVTKLASGTIYEGNIQGKQVALLQSGIGKVAAAMGTTALLQLTQPDLVINPIRTTRETRVNLFRRQFYSRW